MRREQYLTKPPQYALVYSKGNSWASQFLVLKAIRNGRPLSRYGFSVSKKVGNAVVRNRSKRRMREILRATTLKPGHDIIFVVRPAAAAISYEELRKAVTDLLSRARLSGNDEQPGILARSDADPRNRELTGS